MKALIIDDNTAVRKCLIDCLPWKELGFHVLLEACDGQQGLDIALLESPELVIADIQLSALSGIDLTAQLRHHMPEICILILCEHLDFHISQQAIRQGVYDLFLKPLTAIRLAEMEHRIRQAADDIARRNCCTMLLIDRSTLRDVIHTHFETRNAQSLAEAFEQIAINSIRPADHRLFAMQFLSELFSEAEHIVLNQNQLHLLRQQAIKQCSQVRQRKHIFTFVSEMCSTCLSLCPPSQSLPSPHAGKMVRYIQTHYMDPELSVTQLAKWMHLSPIYVGALFKKCEGKTVVSYIHEVRIEEAKKLLQDPSISVKEISNRVGYITPDYFTRLFNRIIGVSPSRYRAMLIEQEQKI